MDGSRTEYVHCPLRSCDWRTVDRSRLGHIVLVEGVTSDGLPNLVTRGALLAQQDEVRDHVADAHRGELQLMLAGTDGGRGEPVDVTLRQTITRDAVQGAEDMVLSVLVPKMRAQFAADLARKDLRPLDPWPAMTVLRYRWETNYSAAWDTPDGTPAGMRLAGEGERPDMYVLELRTDAVADTRTVAL
jgi:hypothetical protein